jgi:ABC-type lipoprotein release transport system permease subunit
MDLTVIIQVALGMIFVWVILAVITSQIQEWIASILSWRASLLEATIQQILGNPALKDKLYSHPLIQGLYTNNGKRKPAGIPEDKFALILFEEVINSGVTIADAKNTFDNLKKSVKALKDKGEESEMKNFALSLDTLLIGIEEKADDATHAITEARKRVEGWFNNSMDRLGGAFRRRMQIIAIVVGVTIAAALNVDTGAILTTLWRDPVLRQAVVTQANQLQEAEIQAGETPSVEEIAKNVEKLNVLSLPIGWSPKNIPTTANGWVAKIIGILLSGMAAAQGAPYWFDLMRKLLTRNPPVPPEPA